MRAVSDSGNRTQGRGRRDREGRAARGLRPGEALIVGGFSPRGGPYPRQMSRRRSTARAAAPLAVPVALGVTLGIILAVSSPSHAHVTQGNAGTSSSSTHAPAPSVVPRTPLPSASPQSRAATPGR